MANRLSVPVMDSRPGLTRSRSSSSPGAVRDDEKVQAPTRPTRPTHIRSRSYMSPIEQKPISSSTFPGPEKKAERSSEHSVLHRLHLHGRHHHRESATGEDIKASHRLSYGRHRYTQSDAQQFHRKRDSTHQTKDSPGTPTFSFTPASISLEQPNDLLYPSSRGTIPSLQRMASSRSYRGQDAHGPNGAGRDPRSDLRRRATSDPRSPTRETGPGQLRPVRKTPIELQLERADEARRAARQKVTEKDIKRTEAQLQAANHEIKARLSNTTRVASDLMRRLDDAQDTLFRTTESLVDTISSFTNLSDQSTRLIANFDHESHHFDDEIRRRITRFRDSICKNRSRRVDELERRGRTMSEKAAELERRLENCRTIVVNWEERETNKRRAWRGVWVGIAWGVTLITIAVLAGIAGWKATDISRGQGTAAERLRHIIVHNRSYDASVVQNMEVPDDVKQVLLDIDARVRKGQGLEKPVVKEAAVAEDTKGSGKESRGFRLLDEL